MDNLEILSYHLGGNSFPIVIKNGSKKFLVKLRAGLCGEYSLLSEWLGNQIGRFIGLNTRQPYWILLPDSLKYENVYVEVRDLIDKSLGINIGFEYCENASVFDLSRISKIDKVQQMEIFLLDLVLLNIDRTTQNHNLLIDGENVIITDYDASLIFNELIHEVDLPSNMQVLQCLKSNPFYQKIGQNQMESFLNKIKSVDFDKIVSGIPNELLPDQMKRKISKKVEDKKAVDWNLVELLENLEKIKLETESERNLRIKKNRERLEKLVRSGSLTF